MTQQTSLNSPAAATGNMKSLDLLKQTRRCLACDAAESRVLFTGTEERFGLGGSFPVLSCKRCGFSWTGLDQDIDLDWWYEEAYWRGGEDKTEEDGRQSRGRYLKLRRIWRLFNGSARPSRWVQTGRVLDVGCGPGYDTLEMRELGARVIGIERSVAALRQATSSRAPVVRGQMPNYPFADGSFDRVVMSQVLEHLPDPASALVGASRILRPGGRLLVLLPNAAGAQRRMFGQHWSGWHLPYHLWHFDATALQALIERCGFNVDDVRTCSPGEWFLLSLGLRLPSLRRLWANRMLSRILRMFAAPPLRLADAVGQGDCLVVEAIRS